MTFLKGLAAAAAAFTTVLALGGPATAQGWSHNDPQSDVFTKTQEYNRTTETDGPVTWAVAPEFQDLDITSLSARHTRNTVYATAHLTDFSVSPYSLLTEIDFFIQTGSGHTYDAYAYAYNNSYGGTPMRWWLAKDRGSFRCAYSHSYDAATHTFTIAMPRTCLGRPGVVRVGASTTTDGDSTDVTTSSGTIHTSVTYFDSAVSAGLTGAVSGPHDRRSRPIIKYSPWLKRG